MQCMEYTFFWGSLLIIYERKIIKRRKMGAKKRKASRICWYVDKSELTHKIVLDFQLEKNFNHNIWWKMEKQWRILKPWEVKQSINNETPGREYRFICLHWNNQGWTSVGKSCAVWSFIQRCPKKRRPKAEYLFYYTKGDLNYI